MIDKLLMLAGIGAVAALLALGAWFSWVENEKAYAREKEQPGYRWRTGP